MGGRSGGGSFEGVVGVRPDSSPLDLETEDREAEDRLLGLVPSSDVLDRGLDRLAPRLLDAIGVCWFGRS